MPSLSVLAAPLALIMPVLSHGPVWGDTFGLTEGENQAREQSEPGRQYESSRQSTYPHGPLASSPMDVLAGGQTARQVRIDQRVIVRISPARRSERNNLLARLPRNSLNTRFEEREMDRCLPVSQIAGVQTGTGNRLLLFLNNQRIVSVNLERACRARDFYSGFYVERSDDGQICVDRDELQSRSGAKCEVERMSQLVPVED